MVMHPTIQLASLGMTDSLILMVLALVVFGPRRLPQIGRQIGKLMYEFRKASNDFKFQMEEELRSAEESDRRKKEEERLRALAAVAPAPPALTAETPGVEAPTAACDAENPYPEENSYPYTAAPESRPEEAIPTIRPPSTGEPVPAARPASLVEQIQALALPSAPEAPALEAPEAAQLANAQPGNPAAAEEQAVHHA
jgi:sec-independent protein translocase protein TatB